MDQGVKYLFSSITFDKPEKSKIQVTQMHHYKDVYFLNLPQY